MKNPVEIRPPSGDHLLVILRIEKSKGWISPTLLDDLPLNLRHGSALEIGSVLGLERAPPYITHVVNWFIASHTE